MKIKFVLCLVAVSLFGCGEEEVRTVPYFLEHEDEMKVKIQECIDSPGEAAEDPECANAKAAKSKKSKNWIPPKLS